MLLLIIRHVEGRGIHQNFASETGFYVYKQRSLIMFISIFRYNMTSQSLVIFTLWITLLMLPHYENNSLFVQWEKIPVFHGWECNRETFCWTGYMDLLLSALYVRDEGISQEEFEGSFCLFVCLEEGGGGFVPLQNFSLIWRLHHCRWTATKIPPMLGSYGHWAMRVL